MSEKPEDQKKTIKERRTKEIAATELQQAHAKWSALPEVERGLFNVEWIQRNGHSGLYSWALKHGGLKTIVALIGGEVEHDFSTQRVGKYTTELFVQELTRAHSKWKDEKGKGSDEKFGFNWLRENGHAGLYEWARKNDGLERFVLLAGEDVARDFEKPRVAKYTEALAVHELQTAHSKWKALPEDTREAFNAKWLSDNGYGGLYTWCKSNGGANKFTSLAGEVVAKDFIRSKKSYSQEVAIQEIQAAHATWSTLPKENRPPFNVSWLQNNGHASMYGWLSKNGGTKKFVLLAGEAVSKDFEVSRYNAYTPEIVIRVLQEAHRKWKTQPADSRQKFNTRWLDHNGYAGLYGWFQKNGGVEKFVALAGESVAEDFEKSGVWKYTEELAVKELETAHAAWQNLPENERPPFSILWLQTDWSNGLVQWVRKNGGMEKFVLLANGDVVRDFERNRKVHTEESIVQELRAAHAKWSAATENTKEPFNRKWFRQNGFMALYEWMRLDKGFDYFSSLAGSNIEADFQYPVTETKESNIAKQKLQMSLVRSLEDIVENEKPEAQHFRSLVTALGSSRALDILYKFQPEYRNLQPEYVKGVLADYLGDFLAQKRPFKIEDVEASVELLSDLTFREGLFETLKDHCLRYYFEQKKTGEQKTSSEILYGYLAHIKEALGHIESKELEEVIRDVVRYYDSVLKDFGKPRRFVDALDKEREFPDINQRINMKELADKRRLLIADEMGLGKSASVIMAKEHLRVGCALVVAPSNVLSTWQRYLSDDPEQGGYFHKGEAPRVLVVENPEQLEQENKAEYDYILISQERLNDRYVMDLKASGYDMLVVDEVHKLKSLEGERTKGLLELSESVEGEGKYLALLSGTPAPNKVQDIAVALKLLYPEKFQEYEPQQLVSQIIRGDLVDLRALLLPRMQMKTLEESVDMPELHETTVGTKLSDLEQDVYDILLEDDELTAIQKMTMLRQFVMNPDLLDATPGIQSTKIEQVAQDLRETFATHRKAVMFVNGYVEGMIRGEETIIPKLGLPDDVIVRVIHGENRAEREAVQQEFRESEGKMLLVVSGQTADVGVDFTAGEKVFMYNEPWTEYERRQQVSRTYRPGIAHDLEARTYITEDTIEEGIHDYIMQKYRAVEKLLHGIPLQDLEKQLLTADEKRADGGLEVNQELAEYYFSSWDKLMKMFAYVKEIGEKDFQKFLAEHGRDYAESYVDLGNRSYQANANRVTGTLIDAMIRERGEKPEDLMILDLASGPEMLKQHIPDEERDRVVSADANLFHFKGQKGTEGRKAVAASWLNLPFREKSFHYLNLSLALPYSNFVPSQGKLERLQVLSEANRVLKPGGRIVLNFIYSMEFRDPAKFNIFAEKLGFRVVEEYSGEAKEGDRYRSGVVTLEKVSDIEGTPETIIDSIDAKDYSGLKFRKTEGGLRNQRKIVDQFELGGRKFDVRFNEQDKAVRDEERRLLELGEGLKKQYGSIAAIPKPEVIEKGFVRIRVGEKYLLFKKLDKGTGAVIVK